MPGTSVALLTALSPAGGVDEMLDVSDANLRAERTVLVDEHSLVGSATGFATGDLADGLHTITVTIKESMGTSQGTELDFNSIQCVTSIGVVA